MAEKVKVKKMLREIDRIMQHQNNSIAELIQINSAIGSLYDQVRDRIEIEEVTQEECEEMVEYINRFHELSIAIHAGGLAIHVQLHNVQPGNINEGGKCPPWQSDC